MISKFIYLFIIKNADVLCSGCSICFLNICSEEIHRDTAKFVLLYFTVAVWGGGLMYVRYSICIGRMWVDVKEKWLHNTRKDIYFLFSAALMFW